MKHVNGTTRRNRILSFVLTLAMAVTLLPAGLITARTARAEESTVKLYFKLPEGTSANDWGINAWAQDGKTISVSASGEKDIRPTKIWGEGEKFSELLKSDKDGFATATITGAANVKGLQFINNSDKDYDCWNSRIADDGLDEAYFDPSTEKWYKDSTLKNEIISETKNVFVLVGTMPGANWTASTKGNESNTFTSSDDKNFSLTYKNVPKGKYQFKILQDPDLNEWSNTWGSNLPGTDNRELKVTGSSDVTFTLDATDSEKKVKVALEPLESLEYDNPKYVAKGSSVTLAAKGTYKTKEDQKGKEVDLTYSLPEGQNGISLKDNVLSVNKDSTATSATINVNYGSYSEEMSIQVVEKLYKVTVNFYNQEWDTTKSDIHIWGIDKGDLVDLKLNKTVEDKDNDVTWASGTFESPYTKLGLIGRKTAGTWDDGKDANQTFTIPEDSDEVTIWYIFGEKPVAEKPAIEQHAARYIDFTYNNSSSEADKAFFYSWTINDATHFPLEKQADGSRHAKIKVPYGATSVKFVIGLDDSGKDWIKDGGDHELTIPADQTLVFYSMDKGGEPELAAPYNKGYELDPENGKVYFYYRDEDALTAGTLSSEKVSVEIKDGETVELTYNEANKRFEGSTSLRQEKTYYRYKIGDTTAIDKFNTNGSDIEGYSEFEYKKLNTTVKATAKYGSLNYNTNDVISLSFSGDVIHLESASIDATALGAGVRSIDPDNQKVTIACTQDIRPGIYELPVTAKDQYGNVYKTTVTEKVTARTKKSSDDFDWDEANIYFMVTDRFFDGDSSNNTANDQFITDEQKKAGVTTTYGKETTAADGLYHGGDFKGIEDKLDYLKDLGINTIWITPVVQNIAGVTVGTDNHGEDVPYNAAFHGYWASDFTKLNPALGTDADFQSMIDSAHKKGIKIMVDIVVNHAGYGTESTFGNMLRSSDEQVSGDDQKSSLSNLPDFKTEDPEVRAKLVKWQTEWVKKFGIDYFRVDTVKHVDVATWQALKNSLTDVDPSFKMIGEYSGGGSASNGGTLGSGAMDSDLDFDFNDWASQFVKGSISSVENNLTGRNGRLNSTYQTGQFLGSHDEDGFVYKLEQDGMSESDAQTAALVAASLQLTAKGQPVIYYGEEVGQTGANNYPYQTNRYDFDWTKANESNPVFAHYKKLLAIRNEYIDVYARGSRKTVDANDGKGYDVFVRSYNRTNLYNVLNTKNAASDVTIDGFTAGQKYTDIYSGKEYTADKDGRLTVAVPAAKDGGTVVIKGDDTTDRPVTPVTPSEPSDDNPATPDTPAITPDKPAVDPEKPSVDPDQPSKPETPSEPEKPSPEKVTAVADKNGTFKSEDGKTVTNSVVETADGKTYITDDEGKAVKKQVVETSDGKKYLATKDGSLATEGIVKVDGKKYVVTEDSTLAPKGVCKNKYVVKNDDGQLAKKEIVSVKEKVNGKTTTVKYYADKNGRIVKNKIVSVKGSKYLTDKKGRVITGRWVKKGKKKYYCSKSGKITKTVKIRKKSSKKK